MREGWCSAPSCSRASGALRHVRMVGPPLLTRGSTRRASRTRPSSGGQLPGRGQVRRGRGSDAKSTSTRRHGIHFEGAIFRRDAWFGGTRFERARQLGPLLVYGVFRLDAAHFEQLIQIEVSMRGLSCQRTRFPAGVQLRLRGAQVVLDDADLPGPRCWWAFQRSPILGWPDASSVLPRLCGNWPHRPRYIYQHDPGCCRCRAPTWQGSGWQTWTSQNAGLLDHTILTSSGWKPTSPFQPHRSAVGWADRQVVPGSTQGP
jgi:hypothetical protein